MRIEIESPINKYYVQTLCMIFFPGEKFKDEDEDNSSQYLYVKTVADENGISSYVKLTCNGETVSTEKG